MRSHRLRIVLLLVLPAAPGVGRAGADWVEPMKNVRPRFTGTPGTLALFGDSLTVSLAFWAPLRGEPKHMPDAMPAAHARVKAYLRPECWDK